MAPVDEFISNAICANTRRTYQGPQLRYTAWCAANGREPLPITPENLMTFLAFEAAPQFDRTTRTIAVYRSALSTMHEESAYGGQPNPVDDPRVARLLKGVARTKMELDAEKRAARVQADVLTPRFLVDNEAYFGVGADDPHEIMAWAACCLGVFGALRKTELLGSHYYPERRLRHSQITFHLADAAHTVAGTPTHYDADLLSHFSVALGPTKADPLGKNPPHLIYSAVAIRAMWRWVNIRKKLNRADLPHLFYDHSTQTHLTIKHLQDFVSRMYKSLSLKPPKITGKSFRKGAASELVSSGVPNAVGADLGRWKTAAMVDTYATPAAKALRYEKMSRTLGQS